VTPEEMAARCLELLPLEMARLGIVPCPACKGEGLRSFKETWGKGWGKAGPPEVGVWSPGPRPKNNACPACGDPVGIVGRGTGISPESTGEVTEWSTELVRANASLPFDIEFLAMPDISQAAANRVYWLYNGLLRSSREVVGTGARK
jgi:hypothetical protein